MSATMLTLEAESLSGTPIVLDDRELFALDRDDLPAAGVILDLVDGEAQHTPLMLDGAAAFRPSCADDFRYLDGLHPATLKVIGDADTALQRVLDQPVTTKEMQASKGQVVQGDRWFLWSASESESPPLGSVLVNEDGTYWTVLAVEWTELVEVYKVQVRNLAIRPAVQNLATVLKADYVRAAGNDRRAVWHEELADIPARFQPSVEDAQLFLGGDYIKTTYRVYFDAPVPVELAGGQYRLKDCRGWLYKVMMYVDEERIDTLPVAIAVRILEKAEYPDGELPSGSSSGSESESSGSGSFGGSASTSVGLGSVSSSSGGG